MLRSASALSAVLVLLSACGAPPAGGAAPGTPAAVQSDLAQVACPAQLATPARAEGAPVDDVVGLRPGLTLDEAINVIKCHNGNLIVADTDTRFNINSFGQPLRWGVSAQNQRIDPTAPPPTTPEEMAARVQSEERRVQNGGRLNAGEERIEIVAIGAPQQERVFGVWRTEMFAAESLPPVATVAAALQQKYGAPSHVDNNEYSWVYDTTGQLMTSESPGFRQCYYRVNPRSNSNFTFSTDCGLTIRARVNPTSTNPDIAESVSIGLLHQSSMYNALEALESTLAAGDAARRAQEVERARQNTAAPKL